MNNKNIGMTIYGFFFNIFDIGICKYYFRLIGLICFFVPLAISIVKEIKLTVISIVEEDNCLICLEIN